MKRYTNRLVAGLLVLLMLVAAFPVAAFAETTETKNESAAEESVHAAPNEEAVDNMDTGDLDISDPIVPTPVGKFDPAVGREIYIKVSNIKDGVYYEDIGPLLNVEGFELTLYQNGVPIQKSELIFHVSLGALVCKFSGVKPGKYKLKITKMPEGYEEYDTGKEYDFEVDETGYPFLEIYQKDGNYHMAKANGCVPTPGFADNPMLSGYKTPLLLLLAKKSKATKVISTKAGEAKKLEIGKNDIVTYTLKKTIHPDHNTVYYFHSNTLGKLMDIGAYVDQGITDVLDHNLEFQDGSFKLTLDGKDTDAFEASYDPQTHTVSVKDKSKVNVLSMDVTNPNQWRTPVKLGEPQELVVEFKVKVLKAEDTIVNEVDGSTTKLIPFKIKVQKKWQDNNDQAHKRPASVTIVLKGDGVEKARKKISAQENWEWTFTGLPKKNAAGNDIVYTVEELHVDGYKTKTTGDATQGFTVTNTLKPTVEVTAKKVWVGDANRTDARPASIEFILKADGMEKTRKTVGEGEDWQWTFRNLPKENDDGNDIVYTIEEVPVEGYKTTIAGDAKNGFTVTNRLIPPPPTTHPKEIAIPVEKVWEDDGNREKLRPTSVTVRLYADGKDTGKSVVLTETNDWKGKFLHLPEFNAGKKIVYTIEEERVAQYASTVTGNQTDGFTVTNRVEEPPKPPKPPTPPTPPIPPTPPVIIVPRIPRAGVGA